MAGQTPQKGSEKDSFSTITQADLFSVWEKTLTEDPHFSESDLSKKDDIAYHSKAMLAQLIDKVQDIEVPDFLSSIEPVVALWNDMLADYGAKGFSIKDTALLLLSFKTSLMRYMNDHADTLDPSYMASCHKLQNLLDFLGLLTFERYSNENETRIDRQSRQINYLQSHGRTPRFDHIIGSSPEMGDVYKAMGLVLDNDISVLLQGESGTGKDLIAHAIHSHSKRQKGPFITLNCGAIPKDLMESELFGHEKGAFTGAVEKRLGTFELADGGTLFLDEIGDMPLALQVKLLRVLQNKDIQRLGGKQPIPVNVRIIAATHHDLKKAVDGGTFRLDLYYRLHVFPIYIPPLRERVSDIDPLALLFLSRYSEEFKLPPATLSPDGISYLHAQPWPGNVRELENLMQRMAILAPGQALTSQHLSFEPGLPLSQPQLPEAKQASSENRSFQSPVTDEVRPLEDVEKYAITQALKLKRGVVKHVANALGVSRTTLYAKAKKYGICLDKELWR